MDSIIGNELRKRLKDLSALENKEEIMLSVKEELVRMAYRTFPDIAIKYADELFAHYDTIDEAKTIDILGFMSVSFEITGNYLAAIECADKALEKEDGSALVIAIINPAPPISQNIV